MAGLLFRIGFLAMCSVVLCLFPFLLNAKTLSFSVNNMTKIEIQVPAECAVTQDSRLTGESMKSCGFVAKDKGHRTIILIVGLVPLEKLISYFGISDSAFSANPNGYLRTILRAMEKKMVSSPPAPGQNLVNSGSKISSSFAKSHGMDECLFYDFDYTDADVLSKKVRLDNKGVRCMSYNQRQRTILSVKIEYKNFRFNRLKLRAVGFEREARRVMKSLRIRK